MDPESQAPTASLNKSVLEGAQGREEGDRAGRRAAMCVATVPTSGDAARTPLREVPAAVHGHTALSPAARPVAALRLVFVWDVLPDSLCSSC